MTHEKHNKITIPTPCNQRWDDMQEEGPGRYCESCKKVVVDFTRMDDAAFVQYFRHASGDTCGRVTQRQLNITIAPKPLPYIRFGKWAGYVAASMLTAAAPGGKAQAQQPAIVTAPAAATPRHTATATDSNQATATISGCVQDETGEQLSGATVVIERLGLQTFTDMDGQFSLTIPGGWQQYDPPLLITAALPGTEQATLPLDALHCSQLVFQLNPAFVGGIQYYKPGIWRRFKYWVKHRVF